MTETTVIWHKDDDSFTIQIGWHDLNMLQRAIQRSPYAEMRALWNVIITALCDPATARGDHDAI